MAYSFSAVRLSSNISFLTGEQMHSTNITYQLQQDHKNYSRLLELLENEIKILEQGQRPHYDRMLDITYYMIHYPTVTHHKIEEAIFDRLVALRPELEDVVNDLIKQHQQLHNLSTEIENLLRAVTGSEAIISRERIVSLGRQYIELHRQHVTMEESQVLPLASKVVPDQDWDEIGQAAGKHAPDPLFGKQVMKDYQALYQSIIE